MFNGPKDPQELLAAYVEAKLYTVNEFSGDISRSCRELRAWADAYAKQHRLFPPDVSWEDYIFEEEEEDA